MRIKAPADGPSEYNVFQRDTDFNYGAYRIINVGVGENGLSSNNTISLMSGKVMSSPNEFVVTTVGWEFDTIVKISTTGVLNRLQRNVIQVAQAMEITLWT